MGEEAQVADRARDLDLARKLDRLAASRDSAWA
jgi:hypothetical protein